MSAFVAEKQRQAKALSLFLVQKVREFFKDEENRREFETWYEKRYGKKYEWKRVRL